MENIINTLASIFKKRTIIDSMMKEFSGMMGQIKRMYGSVARELFSGKVSKRPTDRIYREDIFVNKSERSIRKQVVEHLVFEPKSDVGSSLVLMSVVKDAERIGDFCKNMHEVSRMFKKFSPKHKYYRIFKTMSDSVAVLIGKTERVFKGSLEPEANEVLDEAHRIGRECDALLEELAGSKLSANDAVCLSLLSRYLKRIASHLSNIASAVILPVHKIDFAIKRKTLQKGK